MTSVYRQLISAETDLQMAEEDLIQARLLKSSALARLRKLRAMIKKNPKLGEDDGSFEKEVILREVAIKTGTPIPNLTGADNTLAKNNKRKLKLSNGTYISRAEMEGYIKFYDENGDKIKADSWRKTLAEFDASSDLSST